MAGRVNMRKHSRIKKCREEDRKDGRKHPIEDQKWCLWDSDGEKILYAGPSRKAVEKQERAVQYYKHNGSVVIGGQVFRRVLIQAADPGPFPLDPSRRTAYSTQQMEEEVGPWLNKFMVWAMELEETQDDLLEWLVDQPMVVNQMLKRYKTLLKPWNRNKLQSFVAAYGDIGMDLIEVANDLQTIFRHKKTARSYVNEVAPFMEGLPDTDKTKALFLDVVETLHLDEAVA